MTKWGAEPPSVHLWKSLMSDCISLESLRFNIKHQKDFFTEKFGRGSEYPRTQSNRLNIISNKDSECILDLLQIICTCPVIY